MYEINFVIPESCLYWLLGILGAFIYTLIGGMTAGIAVRNGYASINDNSRGDTAPVEMIGIFWPISLSLCFLYYSSVLLWNTFLLPARFLFWLTKGNKND